MSLLCRLFGHRLWRGSRYYRHVDWCLRCPTPEYADEVRQP